MNQGLLESLYNSLVAFSAWFDYVLKPSEVGDFAPERAREMIPRLTTVSERVGTPYALCLRNQAVGMAVANFEGDLSKTLSLWEASISLAEQTRDVLLVGYSAQWCCESGKELWNNAAHYHRADSSTSGSDYVYAHDQWPV